MATDEPVRNHLFDEIQIGDQTTWSKKITREDLSLVALLAGVTSVPQSGAARPRTVPPVWAGAMVAAALSRRFPGPGTICRSEAFEFHNDVKLGDTVTLTATVRAKDAANNAVTFDCRCVDTRGANVLTGSCEVIAPTERLVGRSEAPPQLRLFRRERYERLIARCAGLSPLRTAIVHPCDVSSISAAHDAAKEGIIVPILVGPETKIRAAAETAQADIREYRIIDVPHSHAAADKAVELVRLGEAQGLMKGSLHTDEVLSAVVKKETGLRTQRRISHCFIMDVPTYPKPLVITDAAVNIAPTLAEKVDIVQNAIDLVHTFGLDRPCVAILSAVETVNPKIPSTLDAAALCKMADRGQITGGLLDGPLAFDNAISVNAAEIKGIRSAVAGHADILVVPDLEAGNMVYKNLSFLAEADGAGVVLGARAPIILTSRADSARTKLASCAVASLYAHAPRVPMASAAE